MQHEYHRCPVTALACWTDHVLLAGEGNYLKAYDITSGHCINSVKVFDSQAIHGVLAADHGGLVLVWGGRFLRVLTVSGDGSETDIRLGDLHNTDDWILDVGFAPSPGEGPLVAGITTAHNALWTLRIGHVSGEHHISTGSLELAVSGSNCILYSAHIKWLSASHCLIASGTAFGDVILWSSFFEEDKSTRTQVHFTFSAHEGSVFGVQISSLLKLPGHVEKKRLLASCSDDRTLRVRDISDLSTESPTLTQVQRDTGFGSRSGSEAHAPPLLAKVMGHTSRIWHIRFLYDNIPPEDIQPKILSCGEDAAANTWQLAPSASNQPYELRLVNGRCSHSGKSIWSVAQHESGAVVTGGADGAIAQYPRLSSYGSTLGISRSLLHAVDPDGKDNYKAYAFVSADTLVSTTEQGRVVLLDINGDGAPAKELSPPLPGLRGYSIVTSLNSTAFIAGSDGAIWCYTHESAGHEAAALVRIAQRTGKTAGLFAAKPNSDCLYLLTTGVGQASASLYTLGSRSPRPPVGNAGMEETHLALPDGLVVTSFAVFEAEGTCYALVGSRTGSLIIYAVAKDDLSLQPSCTQDLLHGKEAITSLTIEHNGNHGTFILSTGRDGMLAIQRLSFENTFTPSLELVHQLSLPLGPNIEGLFIRPDDQGILAWGFRGKHFIQYDACEQQEVMSVECGGAHRNWSFQPSHHGRGGSFVWTKASKVFRYTQTDQSCKMLNAGGHGREIKAIAVSGKLRNGEGREIVATGAEDTDIKLFHLNPERDGHGWKCMHTLRKHNTGIQHLAWDGEYLFSSGGFEEFFVWKATLDVPSFEVGVVCESTHPRSGKSDLRICGFDVRRTSRGDEPAAFEICMAYSDSSLKRWRYTSKGSIWELCGLGDYLTACLTHILHPSPNHQGPEEIITAATDGHLAVWTPGAEDTLTWHERHKVHQSAIHALTPTTLGKGSTLIVTGGDDNAVGFTRITTTAAIDSISSQAGPDTKTRIKTLLIPRAHAAAVTGLALLPLPFSATNTDRGTERESFWLISASIDQRVKLWRVTVDCTREGVEGVEVEKVQSAFTSVADVSGLHFCTLDDGGKGVVVCGVGMDVWKLPVDNGRGQ